MFLTRLIYASRISDAFESKDIDHILESARKNNKANNITGMLCFNRKFFLQCIEGSRDDVNNTYRRILHDYRHTDIIMLDYKEIVCREFSSWTMGYMPETSLTDSVNLKYSGTPNFDPYEMSGESSHLMMMELKALMSVDK